MTLILHFRLSYSFTETHKIAHGKRKWQSEKLEYICDRDRDEQQQTPKLAAMNDDDQN